jgi:hypothetical protein
VKSGTMIESPSGQGMILNRKLALHYRRLLTESVSTGGIVMRMHAREVLLRACARSRRAGDDQFCVALFVSQVFPYRSVKTVSGVTVGGPERMFRECPCRGAWSLNNSVIKQLGH